MKRFYCQVCKKQKRVRRLPRNNRCWWHDETKEQRKAREARRK